MRTLKEVRAAYKEATDLLPTLTRDAAAFAAKEAEITAIEAEMDEMEREAKAADIRNRALALGGDNALAGADAGADLIRVPAVAAAGDDVGVSNRFAQLVAKSRRSAGVQFDRQRHFGSFGEQLQAIANYSLSRGANTDARLTRAPSGSSAVDPTGGGFLIQTDFASAIWMLAHDMGHVLGAVNSIPVGDNANGIKIPGVDETSRANGARWGGVSTSWVAEGVQPNASQPKFRMIEFDLKKLMSVAYATDEMLADAPAITSILGQAFSEEVMFATEDAIFNGTGAGQPLGVLNSAALIQVAKQPGQAAGTIVKENIDNLWARMWARSRDKAVWFINQDCEPALNQLGQVVGTGGSPVYLPAGGLSAKPYASLYGRPVIATEYNSALGAPGDILLADLSQYTKVDKGGVNSATSMHVAFLTDQMAFRITYRVDGKPMWTQPLTPYKGSLTKSPFVALAQR